jgi:perosamine synthetase
MSDDFLMQMRPWFGREEKNALANYMDEDGFLTEFKHTREFEDSIADYTGARHCIVVNNGTISLTLAAIASGVESGDEVIIPNYTMIASPNSIQMFGAKPVFVDVELETLCLDIDKVRCAITSKTKAIMLVLPNGRFPKSGIEAFQKLCADKGLLLIEDAAQSLGSLYPDGVHIGRKGVVGSFSFSTPKIISTGQGGALITDNNELASSIRKLKDFGRSSGGSDIHNTIGYNFKFTELQAVVGIEQMKKLKWRVERKKNIYLRYQRNLINTPEISFFQHDFRYTTPWFIDCIVEAREELKKHLLKSKIGVRVMYPPLNSQMAYQISGEYPVSELIGKKGLWLPSMSQISDEEIDRICFEISKFFRKKFKT